MSNALLHCIDRAEDDARVYSNEADRLADKPALAHHYRRFARRRREVADALLAQLDEATRPDLPNT